MNATFVNKINCHLTSFSLNSPDIEVLGRYLVAWIVPEPQPEKISHKEVKPLAGSQEHHFHCHPRGGCLTSLTQVAYQGMGFSYGRI